jgi:hypothetical protein
MKKLNILAALSFVLMILVSCSEEITREPSPEFNPSSNKVYFPKQESKLIVPINAETIEVQVARKVVKEALTVGLKYSNTYTDFFKGPETVTFAAGDSVETIQIALGAVELMKEYHFSISVADVNQTDPYTVSDVYPVIAMNVLKEDFAPYAEGKYTSVFFGDVWDQILEYSPATKLYRLPGLWVAGYDVKFSWDGTSAVTVNGGTFKPASTAYKPAVQTGYLHPSYGMVWAIFNGANSYDSATKTFSFTITWRVTAGSFKPTVEKYQITKLLQ